MKIAFDHTIFLKQKHGGVSRYFIELQKNLTNKHNSKIFCPIYVNEFLKSELKNNFNFLKIEGIPKYMTKILNFINYKTNDLNFLKWKPDIIHKTYFNSYEYRYSKAKKVINVWDLSHEIFHDMYQKNKNWRPKINALKNIDHVICSSKNTQKELVEYYNFDFS